MWELVLLYLKLLSDWFRTIIGTCILFIPASAVLYFLLRFWIKWRSQHLRPHLKQPSADCQRPLVVGFFHPYCNAGGGGERVLWIAIRALQKRYKFVRCVVYSGDSDVTGEEILQRVWQRFHIRLTKPVEFVFLTRRNWVEASRYPYFTMLGQSFGSVVLGWEALMKYVPDIYIDSMGYAFTIPLFKYLGESRVGCYVHYPTISTDMLKKVSDGGESHNNRSFISRSPFISSVKIIYYRLFAYMYGVVGSRCDVVLVNSSWTLGHISTLWNAEHCTSVVYPPCDTDEFLAIPLKRNNNGLLKITSVAQFRPEKDHPLQINSFYQFLKSRNDSERKLYRLVLIGGCRNAEDTERVTNLKKLCDSLGISDFVEFKTNISFEDLKQEMGQSVVGLHTMWNEHFGIGVVEMMAAGCIMLAHNSGGPKMDIVIKHNGQPTGFLADDVTSYKEAMEAIFNMESDEQLCLQLNARDSVYRFSQSKFEEGFLRATERLFHPSP